MGEASTPPGSCGRLSPLLPDSCSYSPIYCEFVYLEFSLTCHIGNAFEAYDERGALHARPEYGTQPLLYIVGMALQGDYSKVDKVADIHDKSGTCFLRFALKPCLSLISKSSFFSELC